MEDIVGREINKSLRFAGLIASKLSNDTGRDSFSKSARTEEIALRLGDTTTIAFKYFKVTRFN